ncbi:TPA: hypothetical protein ACKQBU_000551 [Stenotrophomonas maltophilia]
MGIELELKGAISSTEELIDTVRRSYGGTMLVDFAEDSVHRAREVLGTDEKPAMQDAWLEVTVAQASLNAQIQKRCRKVSGLPGAIPASIGTEMETALASMRNALRQIFAKPQLLNALPQLGDEEHAVHALLGEASEVAANDADSAAAWIHKCKDKLLAAAKDKADAKASASANSASVGGQKREL